MGLGFPSEGDKNVKEGAALEDIAGEALAQKAWAGAEHREQWAATVAQGMNKQTRVSTRPERWGRPCVVGHRLLSEKDPVES